MLCKRLLTKHLKEVHGLVAKKAKPRRPSTSAGGLRHQDHAKMNACILGNAMAMKRHNDQKVISHTRAKAQQKWDNLVTLAKQCPPSPKLTLVKLASEQLLKVLGFNASSVGSVSKCNITNGERWRFTREYSIHLLWICMTIEDGMGCKKLGSRFQ